MELQFKQWRTRKPLTKNTLKDAKVTKASKTFSWVVALKTSPLLLLKSVSLRRKLLKKTKPQPEPLLSQRNPLKLSLLKPVAGK
jgi:hypothetical protein